MRFVKIGTVAGLAIAAAACGGGSSDNVMSPEANTLEPADVNAALGPEVTNTTDMNIAANDVNAAGSDSNMAYPPDEPAMNNGSE